MEKWYVPIDDYLAYMTNHDLSTNNADHHEYMAHDHKSYILWHTSKILIHNMRRPRIQVGPCIGRVLNVSTLEE